MFHFDIRRFFAWALVTHTVKNSARKVKKVHIQVQGQLAYIGYASPKVGLSAQWHHRNNKGKGNWALTWLGNNTYYCFYKIDSVWIRWKKTLIWDWSFCNENYICFPRIVYFTSQRATTFLQLLRVKYIVFFVFAFF